MSVKLSDNFQMREHSWPCRFHIILFTKMEVDTALSSIETKYSLKFKGKQIQAIESIVSGKDTFVVLSTGYVLFTNIEKLHLLFAK